MAKLIKKEDIYFLESQNIEIKYTKLSAFKTLALSKVAEEFENLPDTDKKEKTLDMYLNLIIENTDLENTKDELKDILTFDEIIEMGDLITGTSKTKAKTENFTKTQS